jgi:hypothetical protein
MWTGRLRSICRWVIACLSSIRPCSRSVETRAALAEDLGKADLIQRILDIEWHMFARLRSPESNKTDHGERLYRAMRKRIHAALPEDVLESYLEDLARAESEGRNPIVEKFERREGKLQTPEIRPLISQIVEMECDWKKELDAKSPRINLPRDRQAFRLYVTTELEAFSDRTLELYHNAVLEAQRMHRNLVEERYGGGKNRPPRVKGSTRRRGERSRHRAA